MIMQALKNLWLDLFMGREKRIQIRDVQEAQQHHKALAEVAAKNGEFDLMHHHIRTFNKLNRHERTLK